jgi:hypothetical protein
MYDGATSHINVSLVEWARKHKVILFVLPAHTSHLLQPLDVGCFGPFKSAFYKLCQELMRSNPGKIITRYDICSLACRAHTKALTVGNAVASFKKSGIYPYNPDVIREDQFATSLATNSQPVATNTALELADTTPQTHPDNIISQPTDTHSQVRLSQPNQLQHSFKASCLPVRFLSSQSVVSNENLLEDRP